MTLYTIYRHAEVQQDLIDILTLISDYAGAHVAVRKLEQIESTIGKLAQTPHIGTLRHEICPNLRVIPTARKGVVCFTVDDEAKQVFIVAIAYAGREWLRQIHSRS